MSLNKKIYKNTSNLNNEELAQQPTLQQSQVMQQGKNLVNKQRIVNQTGNSKLQFMSKTIFFPRDQPYEQLQQSPQQNGQPNNRQPFSNKVNSHNSQSPHNNNNYINIKEELSPHTQFNQFTSSGNNVLKTTSKVVNQKGNLVGQNGIDSSSNDNRINKNYNPLEYNNGGNQNTKNFNNNINGSNTKHQQQQQQSFEPVTVLNLRKVKALQSNNYQQSSRIKMGSKSPQNGKNLYMQFTPSSQAKTVNLLDNFQQLAQNLKNNTAKASAAAATQGIVFKNGKLLMHPQYNIPEPLNQNGELQKLNTSNNFGNGLQTSKTQQLQQQQQALQQLENSTAVAGAANVNNSIDNDNKAVQMYYLKNNNIKNQLQYSPQSGDAQMKSFEFLRTGQNDMTSNNNNTQAMLTLRDGCGPGNESQQCNANFNNNFCNNGNGNLVQGSPKNFGSNALTKNGNLIITDFNNVSNVIQMSSSNCIDIPVSPKQRQLKINQNPNLLRPVQQIRKIATRQTFHEGFTGNINNNYVDPINQYQIAYKNFNFLLKNQTNNNGNTNKDQVEDLYDKIRALSQNNIKSKNKCSQQLEMSTSSSTNTATHLMEALRMEKSMENFQIGKVLGFGSYAIVKQAKHLPTNVVVAIKTYEKKKLSDQQKRNNVAREIKILSKLNHPNIIKLYTVIETETQINLVLEYASAVGLGDYLKTRQQKKINEAESKYIFKQIAQALMYCHRKQIVHRDVKLENIMIDKSRRVKLIDFGFSVVLPPQTSLIIFCGTPSYMAPEIVNKKEYTFPVDVWALGILLYKMLSGHFPFKGKGDAELYQRITSGRVEYPIYFSLESKKLISKILRVNQFERITADQILNDEWVTTSCEEPNQSIF